MKAILILTALLSFSACSTKGKIFVNEQAGRLADKEAYEAELERLEAGSRRSEAGDRKPEERNH